MVLVSFVAEEHNNVLDGEFHISSFSIFVSLIFSQACLF
jgi:hypothetical protein